MQTHDEVYLIADTREEAVQMASRLLAASRAMQRVLITAANQDVPDDMVQAALRGEMGVVRARDIVEGNWFLQTRSTSDVSMITFNNPAYPAWLARRDLLRALVTQIEMGTYRDALGQDLKMNVHFIAAKKAISSR